MRNETVVNIGDTYNRWKITSEVYYKTFPSGSKAKFVDCICECGTEKSQRLGALTDPKTPSISCGCLRLEAMAKLRKPVDVGSVFGRLTVVGELFRDSKRSMVDVVCDCGSLPFAVRLDGLKSGGVKSCGCLQIEAVIRNFTTHGMTGTSAYSSWQKLRYRCDSPKDPRWDRYGGRGISYPKHWNTFESFWEEMSEGWYEGADIDRIDFDLSYSKENCRWVDRDVGNHNKSKSLGTSIYKGVYWDKRREKWVARLSRNGIIYLQQRFNDELSAALAYDDASDQYYGDRPNKTIKELLVPI